MDFLKKFFSKHFAKHKIHFVQTGIMCVKFRKDGRNILCLIKTENGKKVWQQNFLVEHLLNEDWEITEQTLKRECEMFKPPMKV